MQEHVRALVERHLPGPFQPAGGNNLLTKCPFHKGGQERKPSFSVNLVSGLFHCFTCHEAGTLPRLLRLLGLARTVIDSELSVVRPFLERARELHRLEATHAFEQKDPFKAETVLPEALLGVYDIEPTPLINAGFDAAILKRCEVGVDRTNFRLTYPIRDIYGNLAGLSAGATSFTPDPEPKYKVYQGGRVGPTGERIPGDFGAWFDDRFPGFRCENHHFLWNFDKVYPRLIAMSDRETTLYIVEGFKACLWMIQCGFENTVALMGSYISERQEQMIHRLNSKVVLCLDNDLAGRRATMWVGEKLWRPMGGRVFVVRYPIVDDPSQPDDYIDQQQLAYMVNAAIPYTEHALTANERSWFLQKKLSRRKSWQ